MDVTSIGRRTSLRLVPFDPVWANLVAGWVQTPEQLRWLAPSTAWPLTAEKVIRWPKSGGHPFLLIRALDTSLRAWRRGSGATAAKPQPPVKAQAATSVCNPPPIGYAELNPMRQEAGHLWLGHVIVAPDHRGRGVGRAFAEALVRYAFDRLIADRLSLVVFPENTAAVQCYRRAGFTIVGEELHRFAQAGPRHRLLRLQAQRNPQAENDKPQSTIVKAC